MPSPTRPRLHVLADGEAVARHAAAAIVERIDAAAASGRAFHLALAGGSTPARAYELLAEREGPWDHVHLWMGDERCVPAGHRDSNARMVRETLLSRSRSRPPVLHELASPEVPEDAAWLYGLQIAEHVPGAVFDMVLLGMGPDGHTASLFPGHPVLDVAQAPVAAVHGSPKPPPRRVTLTLPVLRRARFTLLLATGAEKHDALAGALAGDAAIPLALLGDGLDEVACDAAAAPGAG